MTMNQPDTVPLTASSELPFAAHMPTSQVPAPRTFDSADEKDDAASVTTAVCSPLVAKRTGAAVMPAERAHSENSTLAVLVVLRFADAVTTPLTRCVAVVVTFAVAPKNSTPASTGSEPAEGAITPIATTPG